MDDLAEASKRPGTLAVLSDLVFFLHSGQVEYMVLLFLKITG